MSGRFGVKIDTGRPPYGLCGLVRSTLRACRPMHSSGAEISAADAVRAPKMMADGRIWAESKKMEIAIDEIKVDPPQKDPDMSLQLKSRPGKLSKTPPLDLCGRVLPPLWRMEDRH